MKPAVTYSLISSKALESDLIPLYDLAGSPKVTFIHQGLNDTYLVLTPKNKFVIRIYRHNWKTWDEVEAELKLLSLLRDNEMSVSYALPDKSGKCIQEIECPEGTRYAVVFSHATGESLPALTTEVANLFGQYVGRLHQITQGLDVNGLSRNYTVVEIINSIKKTLPIILDRSSKAFDAVENIIYKVERGNLLPVF